MVTLLTHDMLFVSLQFYRSVIMGTCRGAVTGNRTNVEGEICIKLNGPRPYICFFNIRFNIIPSYNPTPSRTSDFPTTVMMHL